MSTVSAISFLGTEPKALSQSERHRKRPVISRIASMSDEEIFNASVKKGSEKAKETRAARVLEKGPLMFLAAISAGMGIATKGNLSDKVAQTTAGLLTSAAIVASHKIVEDFSERIEHKRKPKTKDDKAILKENAAKVVAAAGVAGAMITGASIVAKVASRKFTPSYKTLINGLDNLKKSLDISKFGVKVSKLNALKETFSLNHPKLSKVISGAATAAPFAAALTGHAIARDKYEETCFNETAKNTNKLSLCREFARAIVENDSCCEK